MSFIWRIRTRCSELPTHELRGPYPLASGRHRLGNLAAFFEIYYFPTKRLFRLNKGAHTSLIKRCLECPIILIIFEWVWRVDAAAQYPTTPQ